MYRLLVIVALLPSACGDDVTTPPPLDAGPTGTPSIAGTPVASFETSTCSTAVVIELSKQIAEETDCLIPGQLVKFDVVAGLTIAGSAVLPYLGEDARADLYAAAAMAATPMQITSAFRTVVQQYLLQRWFELGRCNITAAADPHARLVERHAEIDADQRRCGGRAQRLEQQLDPQLLRRVLERIRIEALEAIAVAAIERAQVAFEVLVGNEVEEMPPLLLP